MTSEVSVHRTKQRTPQWIEYTQARTKVKHPPISQDLAIVCIELSSSKRNIGAVRVVRGDGVKGCRGPAADVLGPSHERSGTDVVHIVRGTTERLASEREAVRAANVDVDELGISSAVGARYAIEIRG